jgi:LisH
MVIMDYLINEGYPLAARKFAIEANIQPPAEIDTMQERVEIRSAIHRGDIQAAIESINELNPQVGRLRLFSLTPLPLPRTLLWLETCFMHHSYTPWGVDEKKTPDFSPQYEQSQNPPPCYIYDTMTPR